MSKVTASGIIAGNISTQRVKLNNGVEIPQVALGVYKAPNDGSTENACKWAFDAGYRHIDSGTYLSALAPVRLASCVVYLSWNA